MTKSPEAVARALMARIMRCPLCQRSAVSMRAGNDACEKCRAELSPTRLDVFRKALGLTPSEIAEHAQMTRVTIQHALRGDRMKRRFAERLSKVSGIPAQWLMDGEPSPFRRKAG